MQQFRLTSQLRELIGQGNLLDILMAEIKSGILISERVSEKVVYMNPQAVLFFGEKHQARGTLRLSDLFNEEELDSIRKQETFCTEMRDKKLELTGRLQETHCTLLLNDITEFVDIVEESNNLKTLNRQLQAVYEQYSDDTICIADEHGIVEFAGEACFRHCGITAREIIGMNIFDLEREQYFYPAATVKVLKSKKKEVVMSETKIGVTLITIGVPIFDEIGALCKVISISRDFSKEVEIASLLTQVKSDIWLMDKGREEHDNAIVTCSSQIYSLMTLMRMAAPTDSTILLEGETGSGKGVFAQYVHRKSKRAKMPFIAVNCGAISKNLIESELFGYEGGAFTGASREGKSGLLELAQGGTLFLDEVGELPLPQQVKLLHVLQDKRMMRVGGREYIDLDFRVIAATNQNLEQMVREGAFREDLYYRLNVVNVRAPRLAERKEDIPLLIQHFLKKINEKNGANREISRRAIRMMSEYDWPGNVRELENTVEMLFVTTADNIIDAANLPAKMRRSRSAGEEAYVEIKGLTTLKNAIVQTERELIALALKECEGNQQKAAELLGVDRSTVTRKINQYGLKG